MFDTRAGNYDWYTLGRGGNGCDRKANATILPIWKHGEFDKPNGDDRSAGTYKCQRRNIQVSTDFFLLIRNFFVRLIHINWKFYSIFTGEISFHIYLSTGII